MPMRSFLDHLELFLQDQGNGAGRAGADDRRRFDLDDPDVAARVQWEALHHALSGRKYKKPPPLDDSSKVQRRIRRHAEEVAQSAWTKVGGFLKIERANCLDAIERCYGRFDEKLTDLAEKCADHYFTNDLDGPAESRFSQTLVYLQRRLERLERESHHNLTRYAKVKVQAMEREHAFMNLVFLELEQELAKANQHLSPMVTLDRPALDARIKEGIAAIIAEQSAALIVEWDKIQNRLRQFGNDLTQALRDLHGEYTGGPTAHRSKEAMASAIVLPRPIAFKTLAQDYAEEALALSALPKDSLPLRSRLGGLPNLPDGCAWPRNRAGNPLHFVAQIDLAEMPWLPPTMDKSGTLLFFVLLDDLLECDSVAVIFDESSSRRVADIPDGLGEITGIRLRGNAAHAQTDKRLLSEYALQPSKIVSVPDPCAFHVNAYSKAQFADYCRRYRSFRTQQLALTTGREPISNLGHHQMFGYVSSVQEPLPADSTMLTLLQIVSDDIMGISIGDGGAIDFRISPQALAHHQWDEVLAIYAGG